MNNNEIAAFENFQFQIGDIVRPVVERVAAEVTTREARAIDADIKITPVIGMVITRALAQDEAGISRFYEVTGVNFHDTFKEFEIEKAQQ